MYCTKCGNEVSETARFCSFCGETVKPGTDDNQPDRQTVVSNPGQSGEQAIDSNLEYTNEQTIVSSPEQPIDQTIIMPHTQTEEQPVNQQYDNNEVQPPPPPVEQPIDYPPAKKKSKVKIPIIIASCLLVLGIAATLLTIFVYIPAAEEAERLARYESAVELKNDGKYEQALEIFTELADYENSETFALECTNTLDYRAAEKLMSAGKYDDAKAAFEALGTFSDSKTQATECGNILTYDKAISLMAAEEYEQAIEVFNSITTYKDSASQIEECENNITYISAEALMNSGDFSGALEILALLDNDFKNVSELELECENEITYNEAIEAYNREQYYTAYNLFCELDDFKDAIDRRIECYQVAPETGILYRKDDFKGSATEIKFITPKEDDDSRYTLIKIYSEDNELLVTLFIHPGKSYTVKCPAGSYLIKQAYGYSWYGMKEMFGDAYGASYQALDIEGSITQEFKRNYICEITLSIFREYSYLFTIDRKDF